MTEDPVYVDQLAAVRTFYTEHGLDTDLAQRVVGEWSDILGCSSRDVVTMLRIADLDRWCVVRGLDRPQSPDDYDRNDDLTLLATAVGQYGVLGEVQPVLRMAGLAALDRLEQVAGPDDAARDELEQLRADLTVTS